MWNDVLSDFWRPWLEAVIGGDPDYGAAAQAIRGRASQVLLAKSLDAILVKKRGMRCPEICLARIRGRCEGDADASGSGGLEWDGASGYLYLTDRTPSDQPGELAYFRAPGRARRILLATSLDTI